MKLGEFGQKRSVEMLFRSKLVIAFDNEHDVTPIMVMERCNYYYRTNYLRYNGNG